MASLPSKCVVEKKIILGYSTFLYYFDYSLDTSLSQEI